MSERSTTPVGRWSGRTGSELASAWGLPLVEAHASIGSTNDRAAELGRRDVPRPAVVLAEEQTAGRGRRGARWQSAHASGIWMSLLLEPDRAFPQLPLVVGVACAEAIDSVLDPGARGPLQVKWPNDLLIADGKVGGILCETGPHGVVVGIGIDVRTPPGGFDPEIASIAAILEVPDGKTLSRFELAGEVIDRILHAVSVPEPFERARDGLATRDALRDRRVETEQEGPGVARGIDRDGGLILEVADGSLRTVTSGGVRLTAAGRGR